MPKKIIKRLNKKLIHFYFNKIIKFTCIFFLLWLKPVPTGWNMQPLLPLLLLCYVVFIVIGWVYSRRILEPTLQATIIV